MDVSFPKGVTLIDGWNEDDQTSEGSGKSSVLNAICWGLFGQIPKDANIDDVIKTGEKACAVEVVFDGAVVRRTRGPNELSLVVNGKTVKGANANETQRLIEEFVGLTFETFCQTVYFAQNYTKKFVTASQDAKGKILSEVQNLSVFDKARKEVLTLVKHEEEKLTKLKHSREMAEKDVELRKRDIQNEELKHQHARQQQEQRVQTILSQIATEEGKHQNLLDQQATRIANVNAQIADAQRLVAEYEASKAQHLAAVANVVYDEPREKALQEANNQLMADAGVVNSEITGIDQLVAKQRAAQNQGARYASRYKQIAADKEKNLAFIANPSKDCPTCGTKLEACDTSHALAEVAKIDQEMAEIETILTQLAAEIDAPIPTKDELNKKLADLRQQRQANDTEIQAIRAVKDRLNSVAIHLSGFDRNIKTQSEKIEKLQVQLAAESQPIAVDTSQLEALKMQLELAQQPLQLDMTTLDALKAKLEETHAQVMSFASLADQSALHLNRLEKLKDGFKEIKSHVFNSLLNELNARVQKYLGHLFEVPVSVRFTNEDMKIETKVKFDGNDRGLGLLSGGQFRRVSLAIDLALADVITSRKGARANLLILDEYFKDLSETSMEKCLALLENRGQPVLLIEHNSIFKNIVNNSVFVRLENGTSHVAQSN